LSAVAPNTSGVSATGAGSTSTGGGSTSTTPNLSGVPASWLVVAYGATFGSGPGSAGSITVLNRSQKTFSGTARVEYVGHNGSLGSSSATFSGLAPGQTEVLPLNGAPYPSSASRYHIVVTNVH
jgi:hypothetical protein